MILVVFLGAARARRSRSRTRCSSPAIGRRLLIIDKVPLRPAVQQMVAQVQSFPLIAIPFFMLTGALMVGGKLGESAGQRAVDD